MLFPEELIRKHISAELFSDGTCLPCWHFPSTLLLVLVVPEAVTVPLTALEPWSCVMTTAHEMP